MTDKFYAIVEFEDGLQVIPNNWLSGDLKKAFGQILRTTSGMIKQLN